MVQFNGFTKQNSSNGKNDFVDSTKFYEELGVDKEATSSF